MPWARSFCPFRACGAYLRHLNKIRIFNYMIRDKELLEMLSDPKTQRAGFAVLVSQYSETLYWKIRNIVLNHDDADDILQNVFIKAWTNLATFQGKSSLSTWLYRIAINEALDFLRKKKQATQVSADDEPGIASRLLADEYFDGDEIQAHLQEAVALLPDVQRTVFTLKYFDNMKYSEISKILSTSEGALKASYHLAVKKITEFLQKY